MTGVYKKSLVFGVFDNFHPGHKHFLSKVLEKTEHLVVVVTTTEIVELLKKRMPKQSFEDRKKRVEKFDSRIVAIPSDAVLGSWEVLKSHKPDMIFLGFDQQGIAHELDLQGIAYEFMDSFQPEIYKSSLLNP